MKKKDKKAMNKKTIAIVGCIIVCLVVIGVILFFVFKKTSSDTNNREFTNVVSLSASDEVKAAKLIKENIVRVVNKVGEHEIVGTGFFLENGYLITNSHNVDIKGDITIEYYDGVVEKAELYSNSIDMDIALLKVEKPKVKYMNFINTDTLEVTNSVLAAGYAFNFKGEATVTKGSVSALRDGGVLKYIQSDISMNKGCSGGPLFNDKAEIIGMNTFASDNGNIGISITSESIKEVLKMLLDDPKANYLVTTRPSNPINSLLVNIGFTEDATYELYGDTVIIKYVVEKDGGSLEENNANLTYYCDDGYTLNGTLCVKEEKYDAIKVEAKCPAGFELNSVTRDGALSCMNFNWADGKLIYGCSSGYTQDGDNCTKSYEGELTASYSTRLGSCPSGYDCYELSTENITRVEKISCPGNSLSSGKFILNGEENIESNYKTFSYNYLTNYTDIVSSTGTYYDKHTITLYNCVKEKIGTVNVIYTKEELESMNVCDGLTLVKKGSAYYCEEKLTVKKYGYNPTCNQENLKIKVKNGKLICYGTIVNNTKASYECKCPAGLELSERYWSQVDGWNYNNEPYDCTKSCWKEEEKLVRHSYKCNDNDILSGKSCIKRTFTNAKTK